MTKIKATLTTIGATLVASPGLADAGDYSSSYQGHMMGGYGFFGGGAMLLFWVVAIGIIVLAVRWIGDSGRPADKNADALEILRARLARGEIDPEEYAARKKALES